MTQTGMGTILCLLPCGVCGRWPALLADAMQTLLLRFGASSESEACAASQDMAHSSSVGGAESIFVGAVVSPEPSVGAACWMASTTPRCAARANTSVLVRSAMGERSHLHPRTWCKTHPKVFDFVACTGDQGTGTLPECIQRSHAQPGPRIRHGQAFAFVGAVGQGPSKRVVHLCQRNG